MYRRCHPSASPHLELARCKQEASQRRGCRGASAAIPTHQRSEQLHAVAHRQLRAALMACVQDSQELLNHRTVQDAQQTGREQVSMQLSRSPQHVCRAPSSRLARVGHVCPRSSPRPPLTKGSPLQSKTHPRKMLKSEMVVVKQSQRGRQLVSSSTGPPGWWGCRPPFNGSRACSRRRSSGTYPQDDGRRSTAACCP
jgi:hypothetical protein